MDTGAWGGFAAALVARAVVRKRGVEAEVEERAEVELDEHRARFIASLGTSSPFGAIVSHAGLEPDDAAVLALAAGIEADAELQILVAHLHGDGARTRLSLGLLSALVDGDDGVTAVAHDGRLRRAALVDVAEDGPWAAHAIAVHPTVIWALAGVPWSATHLPVGVEVVECTRGGEADRLVAVTGPDRARRAQAAMAAAGGGVFVVSPEPAGDGEWEALVRQATILGCGVVVHLGAHLPEAGRRAIERADHLTWAVTSALDLPLEEMPDRPWRDVEAPPADPTDAEWAAALGDAPRTHRLTPDQLRRVQRAHHAAGGDLDRAVRRLAGGEIHRLARRVRPTRTWDDIVLSPTRLTMLREIVAEYRYADVVYGQWGYSDKPSRGLVALFSGPSGTGKTLAAEIVAGELGLDLFKVDLSAVLSKYIGETEQQLDRIFDAASAGNVVLFFDEADALFGKRSEVSDARDRYANLEVSYLLQRLEAYDGLVSLATNFERNIDQAFLRRIQVRVEFANPDVEERRAIWEHHLPAGAPLADDVDLDFLATRFELTGGSIRNATRKAAFLAAAGRGTIDMEALVTGVVREYHKLGRLLQPDEFAPYGGVLAP
jgi:AAA+ superfamily predicted ATPase